MRTKLTKIQSLSSVAKFIVNFVLSDNSNLLDETKKVFGNLGHILWHLISIELHGAKAFWAD